MDLSGRLKEERDRLGLTQQELADRMGVSRKTQINYESGLREPDASYLSAFSALGGDVLFVLTGQRPLVAREEPPPVFPKRGLAVLEAYMNCSEEGQITIENVSRAMAQTSLGTPHTTQMGGVAVRTSAQSLEEPPLMHPEIDRLAVNLSLTDSDRLRAVGVGVDYFLEHGRWPALNPTPRPAYVRSPAGAPQATDDSDHPGPETRAQAAQRPGSHRDRKSGQTAKVGGQQPQPPGTKAPGS